ncbi:mdh [Symbiodinium sp. CCMP2592]|nr:mdh [Symbiodinium sp. CCMP2592]
MASLTPADSDRLRPTGLVYLARTLQTEESVRRWSQALRKWRPPQAPLRVHLEHNNLNEHDAAELLQAIGGEVQAVYLHHNDIRCLEPLAAFIDKHAEPLQELHLSHNRLSTGATRALLLQLGDNRPSSTGTQIGSMCSWLRLEFNHIDVEELLNRLPPGIQARLQLEDKGCTPERCNCKNRRHVKRIHSKLLALQRPATPEDEIHRREGRSEPAKPQGRLQPPAKPENIPSAAKQTPQQTGTADNHKAQ